MTTSNPIANPDGNSKRLYTEPTRRILLMSEPRTGSTLLAGLLSQVGAGDATEEMFHPEACLEHHLTARNALSYLRKIALQRATPEGYFSCKIHFQQFAALFETSEYHGHEFLNYFQSFIITRRRDHIAQAISEYFAMKSGHWNSKSENLNKDQSAYIYDKSDLEPMTQILNRQIIEENGWLHIINTLKINTLHVYYEDLILHPTSVMRTITNHLNMDMADAPLVFPFRKISNPTAVDNFKIAYLNDLNGVAINNNSS